MTKTPTLLLVIACSTTSAVVDPTVFGALPDDGVDDRPAIQAALTAACVTGGEVRLLPGTYDLTRAGPGARNQFAALAWSCPGVSLRGAGEYLTTLRMSGDIGNATTYVISLDPGVIGSRLSDFTIDTSATYNSSGQYHAIAIGSGIGDSPTGPPVLDVTVERVAFRHPQATGERGDCIRVLGNTVGSETRNIRLIDLNFLSCGRSGVEIQRNANDITIRGCYFDADLIGGTPIDGEATGGGWDRGLVIEGNTFRRRLPAGEPYAVTLTSQKNWRVSNNFFDGRGLGLYRTTDGVVASNNFDGEAQTGAGLINSGNITDRLVISNNTIRRTGLAGHAIKIEPHSGQLPKYITIANNQIKNETDGTGVFVHSGGHLAIVGNTIACIGTVNSMGVFLTPISAALTNTRIVGNGIENCAFASLRLPVNVSFSISSTVIVGNTSVGSGPVKCDAWGNNPGSVTSVANDWSAPSACFQ